MLHLISGPLHRWLYRVAYRARGVWRTVSGIRAYGVAVIACNEAGMVLLVRHSYGSGRWSIPGGGRGRSEDPETGARREIREELGCELKDLVLVEISETTIQNAPNTSHIFTASIVGDPVPDGREIVEVGWFEAHALPMDMVPAARHQLQRFLES